MYYIDMPSIEEIDLLNQMRADACVSIYLPTTPVSLDIEQSRINLGNLVKKAVAQLEAADYDRRGVKALQAQFADLLEDMDFWHYQANSLAILATPDSLHTYRMANKLTEAVEVSDRFHLKPLLRALTFPHAAFVLALSEKAVRLIQNISGLACQRGSGAQHASGCSQCWRQGHFQRLFWSWSSPWCPG